MEKAPFFSKTNRTSSHFFLMKLSWMYRFWYVFTFSIPVIFQDVRLWKINTTQSLGKHNFYFLSWEDRKRKRAKYKCKGGVPIVLPGWLCLGRIFFMFDNLWQLSKKIGTYNFLIIRVISYFKPGNHAKKLNQEISETCCKWAAAPLAPPSGGGGSIKATRSE
jgi:hypothetical protein